VETETVAAARVRGGVSEANSCGAGVNRLSGVRVMAGVGRARYQPALCVVGIAVVLPTPRGLGHTANPQ